MRIVKVIGGLGNQMFQYALSVALKAHFPEERVLLDLRCFRGYPKHFGFELPAIFAIDYAEASWRDVARVAYPYPNFQTWRFGSRLLPLRKSMLLEKKTFDMEPTALTRSGDTYYDGYWQHEEYFRDIRPQILDVFRFPDFTDEQNMQAATRIAQSNSVSIHVRRGDYLTDPLFRGTGTLDYYAAAIRRMKELTKPELFVVFSNDIAWTQQNLAPVIGDCDILYADWNTGRQSFRDIHLMPLCRHNIIANSSFSWWGAWLNTNQEKQVIAPAYWMNVEGTTSPAADSWIKV